MVSRENSAVPVKYKALLVLLSLVGACLVLVATSRYGAGISPDSISYIAIARHLISGLGFTNFDNAPWTVQPPLYPALLGLIDLALGVDPFVSARFVGAAFLGLTLYLVGILFYKIVSPPLAFLGTVSLVVSLPLTGVARIAWSEAPFNFFVTLYFYALLLYFERQDGKRLLFVTLAVVLACLTRYIGVVLILTGVVSILMIGRGNRKTQFTHALTFALLSALPLVAWAARNYAVSRTLLGPRVPSEHSLVDNILLALNAVLRWYVPNQIVDFSPTLMSWGLLAVLALTAVLFGAYAPLRRALRQAHPLVLFALLYVAAYVGFLIVTSTTTRYDDIGNRLLSPIAIPVALLLFAAIDAVSRWLARRYPRVPVRALTLAGVALWLVYPINLDALKLRAQFHDGLSYNSGTWRDGEMISYIRENGLSDCALYSNDPFAMYFYFDKVAEFSPLEGDGAEIFATIAAWEDDFARGNTACLVWTYWSPWRTVLFEPGESAAVPYAAEILQFQDGAIYLLGRAKE